jgi:hypothetical protein
VFRVLYIQKQVQNKSAELKNWRSRGFVFYLALLFLLTELVLYLALVTSSLEFNLQVVIVNAVINLIAFGALIKRNEASGYKIVASLLVIKVVYGVGLMVVYALPLAIAELLNIVTLLTLARATWWEQGFRFSKTK